MSPICPREEGGAAVADSRARNGRPVRVGLARTMRIFVLVGACAASMGCPGASANEADASVSAGSVKGDGGKLGGDDGGSCVPECFGKICGDDGCGSACGMCGAKRQCVVGRCDPACTPLTSVLDLRVHRLHGRILIDGASTCPDAVRVSLAQGAINPENGKFEQTSFGSASSFRARKTTSSPQFSTAPCARRRANGASCRPLGLKTTSRGLKQQAIQARLPLEVPVSRRRRQRVAVSEGFSLHADTAVHGKAASRLGHPPPAHVRQ